MNHDLPLLIDTGSGHTIKYKGKLLYSSTDPEGSVKKRIEHLELKDNTLIFIPSIGLGYGLKLLLDKMPSSCHILCIEADQSLMSIAIQYGLIKDPNLTILRTDIPSQTVKFVHSLGIWNFRRIQPVYLCGGYHINREKYSEMQKAIEEEINIYWQNKMTLINMSSLWIKNLITNIPILYSGRDIGNLKTKKPVCVTGAGPSLENSLDLIQEFRDDVLLLSVDTALPVLMDFGLKPDFVFMLESQIANLQDFLPYRDPDISLICDITSHPRIIRLFDNIFFFSSQFYPLKLFDRLKHFGLLPSNFPPLGSVGVAAVYAAQKITDSPVLITGLDFSYSHFKTHARGAPINRMMNSTSGRLKPSGMLTYEAVLKRPVLKLQDKLGKAVLSDLVMMSYSRQLNNQITSGGRVFDISEGGLPTDASLVDSRAQLLRIIKKKTTRRIAPGKKCTFTPSPQAADDFISSEKRLLKDAEKQITAFLKDEDIRLLPSLEDTLKKIEYTVIHFPDAAPKIELNKNFISRTLVSVRYYLSQLMF